MKGEKQHVETTNMLNVIREMRVDVNSSNKLLTEETQTSGDGAVAITNDVRFGQNMLKTQEESFANEVDGGVQFADENSENPNENPLVYLPDSGNLVFSGTIPSMNNLKWQYSLKDADGTGCFIWVDGLRLTEQNLKILAKIQGHYLNWRDEWQKEGRLLDMIGKG